MNKPDLSTMNAMDFNAFRNQLRDVVILGWCLNNDKEGISDTPTEELLKTTTFDDGSTVYNMRVLYRLATDEEVKSGKKLKVDIMDQLGYTAKVGWVRHPKALWDHLFTTEECPKGFASGDIGQLPNHVVEWYSISQEVERREEASVESDDAYEA